MKNAYRRPIVPTKLTRSKSYIPLDDKTFIFDDDGFPIPDGISLLRPEICSAVLCNYSRLKQDSWGEYDKDLWYLMEDFDKLCDKALANYPLYDRIVEYKIDGLQNIDIQEKIQMEFGIKHSLEYISSLWRNKIPKLIASTAEDEYLDNYYLNVEKGKYKKCSRCGKIKLAHNKYFSKNKTLPILAEAKIVQGERRDKRKPRFRFDYAEPQPIFVPTKIAKGECRDKRKFYFRFGYTEPQPILVCTKIVQAEYKNKSIC